MTSGPDLDRSPEAPDAVPTDAELTDAVATTAALPAARATDAVLIERAESLAAGLLDDAIRRRSRRERVQGRRIARMLDDPQGLEFIVALTDEVLRIRDPRRAARHLRSLVAGTRAGFLGPFDRLALRVGAMVASVLPTVVMPLVNARVRAELSGFVIAAEPKPLAAHIARRRAEGIRLNLNVLGEAVLGEAEAEARLEAVLALLERPDVDYVSVKVSSVCSQLNIAAFDAEVDRVASRVRRLYDAALAARPYKFVNLDMEEYRDLHLTVAVFRRLLDEERYADLDAGIVLQAYIPDSLAVLTDLVAWARERHRRGGAAIKVRIVKGANLAMERVEAELAGWPQAPFATKAEVDANYKRMLDVALDPANAGALRVGVATHNLFEAAWALTVGRDRGVGEMIEMEMLEGMAPALAAAVRAEAGGLLLYAPIARRSDSESVIAYLVRRFDENTGPENFLRHQFSLAGGSPTWISERDRFRAAVADRHAPAVHTRRTQDRTLPPHPGSVRFANEPDTDLALAANREWLTQWLRPLPELGIDIVPAVVAGAAAATTGALEDGHDPAEPDVVAYRWVRSDVALVERAVAAAGPAGERWRALGPAARRDALRDVASSLASSRGRLIGVMSRDGGKTVGEADPEVSEAIDFARYYAEGAMRIAEVEGEGARFSPFGTVVVVPPWNFPLAIPAGGVLAALAAGNAVIFKPAPEAVAVAWALAEACWDAGIPRDLLQFVPCADDDAGQRLVTHPDVDAVILTGSWDTARMFLGWRPDLRLHAETSGKNAIVITAAADLDNAVADLVRSAFGHAGQKCSAASLAIVEASVYDDPAFRRQLADAVATLRPGPGWDVSTTMGPLIRPPEGPLDDALHHLGEGETWLVEPHQVGDNAQLWSPGVKLGVRPGSSFHLTECFGPVLGVMRADDLSVAIAWQNQPAYGLTAGLHSLDPAEIRQWRAAVAAGNLYVNRHITGAIVRRQPFGGWKRSVVGPGHKAGGPNYVASLGTWQADFAGSAEEFGAQVATAWRRDLGPTDRSALVAEADVFRYRPLGKVLLRAGGDVADADVARALAAAAALGVEVTLSTTEPRTELARSARPSAVTVEDEATVAARLRTVAAFDKIRFLGTVDDALRLAAHDAGLWVDDLAVVAQPDLEALRWLHEQALSETRHRHGDLSARLAAAD
jgi:RHH-type transcriptional regulator, proline utilization regulon repressor / proline dehydrogenase / delta 1-pyrroline-5-carboxylate dehydrogenase